MHKTLTAIVIAAALTLTAVVAPQPAEARGGHIAGAIIGSDSAGRLLLLRAGLLLRRAVAGPLLLRAPAVVYEAPPVYVALRRNHGGYSGQTHGGDQCWPATEPAPHIICLPRASSAFSILTSAPMPVSAPT